MKLIFLLKLFFLGICIFFLTRGVSLFYLTICIKPQNDYFLKFEDASKAITDASISPRKAEEIAHLFYKKEYGRDAHLDLFYIRNNDYYFLRKTKNHVLDGVAVNIYSGEVKIIHKRVFYNAPYGMGDQKRLFGLKE